MGTSSRVRSTSGGTTGSSSGGRNNNNTNSSNNNNSSTGGGGGGRFRNRNTNSSNHHHSNHGSSKRKNVSFLLARGGTARGLPVGLLQPLKQEEMEKDLRHIQVYANAVQSYQQQFYLHCNQGRALHHTNNMAAAHAADVAQHHQHQHQHVVVPGGPGGGGGHGHQIHVTPSPMGSLPIRIDPEEEKRLATLRKKITKAEVVREELEQEYVASRAHYVHEAQRVSAATQTRKKVVDFLQANVQHRARVVATQRVRLQMARDVLSALLLRKQQTMGGAAGAAGSTTGAATAVAAGGPTTGSTSTDATMTDAATGLPAAAAAEGTATTSSSIPHLSGDDPMAVQWNAIEEDFKKATAACLDKKKKPMPFPCTHLPVTPRGVPILLSAMSEAPDKAMAFAASTDASKTSKSLVWIPDNIPPDRVRVKEGTNEIVEPQPDDYEAELPKLATRVGALQRELNKERLANQVLCAKIGKSRKHNDECVAMLGILRQETEAVVQRHNTLLESDAALEALERLQEEEEEREQEEQEQQQERGDEGDQNEQMEDGEEMEDGDEAQEPAPGQERKVAEAATGTATETVASVAKPNDGGSAEAQSQPAQPTVPSESTAGDSPQGPPTIVAAAPSGTAPVPIATTATAASTDAPPSLDHVPKKNTHHEDTSTEAVAPAVSSLATADPSSLTKGVPPEPASTSAFKPVASSTTTPVATAVAEPDEAANDGDDEDSEEDGEIQEVPAVNDDDDDEEDGEIQEDVGKAQEWSASTDAGPGTAASDIPSNNKRSAPEQDEGGSPSSDANKRRKL